MEKKTIGLLGALAGLATIASAHAAPNPAEAMHASSYADLLAPVPDAVAVLKADDAARVQPVEMREGEQVAQNYHHHHHQYRRRYLRRRQAHHHHHHHHHQQY